MNFGYENRIGKGSRILVAMSGGVDSSLVASRLYRLGYDIVGITMHLVKSENRPVSGAQVSDDRACCSLSMAEDARRVASVSGFPYYVLNLADEFNEHVVEVSRNEYTRGRTPNPCILCNRKMKFDVLFRRADALGCDFIATGHYAKIGVDEFGHHLFRGDDQTKDQSYFLGYLTEKELERIIFPLGGDSKTSVRAEAMAMGLKVATRPDSQDLCFFTGGQLPDEWHDDVESPHGEIVTTSGIVIGRHDGISRFTIGQRKGLPGGMPEKLYVVDIDAETNRVMVGVSDECLSNRFEIEDVSLVSEKRNIDYSDLDIQIRYRTKPVKGRLEIHGSEGVAGLDEPVRAITPGQAAVWYRNGEVVGAGTISRVFRN